MPENTFEAVRNDMDKIAKDIDYLIELVIFSAAYDFGRRAERGEDITGEVEEFKASMKARAIINGMVE